MSVKVFGKGALAARRRRHLSIRKKISGTPEKPRLVVTRSNRNIVAQMVDDVHGVTVVSASTLQAPFKDFEGSKVEAARKVGLLLAQKAKGAGICDAVFDRNGYKYHGRVAALADGAREGGLKI